MRRLAIIGGGIAGLSAAWNASRSGLEDLEITLVEREDRLGGITVGSAVHVLPSGASSPTPGRVTEVASTGQFATWQAERAVGDHDRNTLRLRVDPQSDQSKLAPGLTVWLVR